MNEIFLSFFLNIFILFSAVPAISESSKNNSDEIETQLNAYWDLQESFQINRPDSALYYLLKLKSIAIAYDKKAWIAGAFGAIGDVQYEQGYLGEAVYNYLEAAKLFEELREFNSWANAYNSIGDIYVLANDYNLAIKYFLEAKNMFYYVKEKNKRIAMVYRNLAVCHKELGNYNEAKAMLEFGKTSALAANDFLMLSLIFNTLGTINFEEQVYDSAHYNYQMAIQYSDSLLDEKRVKASATNNIGEAYFYQGEYKLALDWLNKALEIKKNLKDPVFEQSSRNLLARLYIENEAYDQAIDVLEVGLSQIDSEVVADEVGNGLSLIIEALVKSSGGADKSKVIFLNNKFAIYSQKLIGHNNQLVELREELETIGKQQVVRLAVEKHSMNTKLGVAEEKNEKIKYAIIIPVFLLICAIISVYLSLRRNARYKKLYASIEEVLSNRALRKPDRKQ